MRYNPAPLLAQSWNTNRKFGWIWQIRDTLHFSLRRAHQMDINDSRITFYWTSLDQQLRSQLTICTVISRLNNTLFKTVKLRHWKINDFFLFSSFRHKYLNENRICHDARSGRQTDPSWFFMNFHSISFYYYMKEH